jgi:hypothetical protein
MGALPTVNWVLTGAERAAIGGGGAVPVDEEELAAALVNDARVLGHHPLSGEDDVA